MSQSGESGSGKAGSSHPPAQSVNTGTTPATPTGAGSSTETAPDSSNNTNPSQQAWTTVPAWRTTARRGTGRGGSAGGAYNNPSNTSVRGARNDGTSGRALPTRPTTTTPGTTVATSSSSWAKGPPGRAQAASTNLPSTKGLDPTAEVYQSVPKKPTAPSPAAAPPKSPYQGSTTKPPSKNYSNISEFIAGRASAPAPAPVPGVTTGELSGEARTPVAAEAPVTVAHNTPTAGAAKNDTVIEKNPLMVSAFLYLPKSGLG